MQTELDGIFDEAAAELIAKHELKSEQYRQSVSMILGRTKESIASDLAGSVRLALHELSRIQNWLKENTDNMDVYSVSYARIACAVIESELLAIRELCIGDADSDASCRNTRPGV